MAPHRTDATYAAALTVVVALPGLAVPPAEAVTGDDMPVSPPVVVVGVAGLTWDNISKDRTPTLWSMLDRGADAAAVTVRTVCSPPCPLDGWLSLSAGRAATDPVPRIGADAWGCPVTVVDGGVVDRLHGMDRALRDADRLIGGVRDQVPGNATVIVCSRRGCCGRAGAVPVGGWRRCSEAPCWPPRRCRCVRTWYGSSSGGAGRTR